MNEHGHAMAKGNKGLVYLSAWSTWFCVPRNEAADLLCGTAVFLEAEAKLASCLEGACDLVWMGSNHERTRTNLLRLGRGGRPSLYLHRFHPNRRSYASRYASYGRYHERAE